MVHLFTKFHKYIQYKIQQFFIETEANTTKKKKEATIRSSFHLL